MLAHVISSNINKSFAKGIFPDALKIAKIIPIHKGDKKDVISNYRPISLLPSLSKIYERAIYSRLIEFLTQHIILSDDQYGFRKNRSPKLAILKLIGLILENLSKEKFVISVFLDLKKAFDTLDHDIMLKKLHYYGIRGVYHDWFKSYLCNRRQVTTINSIESNYANVITGVPQGSTIGPLLFLLYINDITTSSHTLKFTLFVDDTNITFSNLDKRNFN